MNIKQISAAMLGSLFVIATPIHAASLKLSYGKTHSLPPGDHKFDNVEMARNSTILVSDTTRIFIKRMVTANGARIEYKRGANRNNPQKKLDLSISNARLMRGNFYLVGTGGEGSKGRKGATGPNGDTSHLKFKWGIPKYKSATAGGGGARGGDGQDGEDGMHIELNVLKLHPKAFISITSNGGNGGEGGEGGNGGNGGAGRKKYQSRGANGGPGGPGGRGGNGGDGGNIWAHMIYIDGATEEEIRIHRKFLDENIHATPGVPGKGGLGGHGGYGGYGGRGARLIRVTHNGNSIIKVERSSGSGGSQGSTGLDGDPGQRGKVDKSLKKLTEWLIEKNRLLTE